MRMCEEASDLREHVDDLAALRVPQLARALDEGEQRVVTAAADTLPRVELGAALADQDLAGVDDLAAEPLHAQPLGVRVAPVARAGRTLLVSHRPSLLLRDLGDLDPRQRLTVPLPLVVPGL